MKGFRNYLHIIIAVLAMVIVKMCLPAINGLTHMGVNVLAVFIPILYLWITLGTDWVSMLALAGLIMIGMYTPGQVYALSFGHTVVVTIIMCMALTGILSDTGVTDKVAVWFITRDIVRNKPYIFLAMFYFACIVLGLFIETMTTTIIFITLAETICKDLGYKKGDQFYTAMMAGVLWFTSATCGATPISHALPLMLMGAAESAGLKISFAQWMSLGVPFVFIVYFLSLIVIRFIWKPDAELFKNYNIEEIKSKQKPLGIEGKVSVTVFFIVIFCWFFPQFGGGLAPEFSAFLIKIGATVPPILAVAFLCILRLKDKPLANFANLVAGIPLGVVIFVATVTVLGSAISSDETGISLFLRNTLAPVTSGMPTIMIVIFMILGTLVLTNFASNTVAMLLFYSVAMSLLSDSEITMLGLTILIGVQATFGLLMPSASISCPLFFGPEHLTVKGMLKYNIIILGGSFLFTMLILWPLAGFFY
jgi:sodium-dependent dicarboxylate transporter 2/3/5